MVQRSKMSPSGGGDPSSNLGGAIRVCGLVAMRKLVNTALTQQRSPVRIRTDPFLFMGSFIYLLNLTK